MGAPTDPPILSTIQKFAASMESTLFGFAGRLPPNDKIGSVGQPQIVVQNQTFVQATSLRLFYGDSRFDGYIGLAFQSTATYNVVPPVQNAINQSMAAKRPKSSQICWLARPSLYISREHKVLSVMAE